MQEVKKAVILTAGLSTRFLPLSKIFSKATLPLVEKPIFHYLLEEILASEIKEVIFVVRESQKEEILRYLKKPLHLEKFLKERKKTEILEKLANLQKFLDKFSFSFVKQKFPFGAGDAILQVKKIVKGKPFAVFFVDDVFESETPCIFQLKNVFKTYQKPIVGLKKMPRESLSHYGVIEGEKIANRFYKIKKIIEKPVPETISSDLAVSGRYILTSEVFDYLKNTPFNENGEIVLAHTFQKMIDDGKVIYGYEMEGKWIECGDLLRWLKSNFYLCLKHPEFGKELKEFLKKEIK